MISPDKFIKAIESIIVDGRPSLGLVIERGGVVPSSLFNGKNVVNVVLGKNEKDADSELLVRCIKEDTWLVAKIENLSEPMYQALKSIATRWRINLSDVGDSRLPDSFRLVCVISGENVAIIESEYPDFRQLFGFIITL